MSVRRLWLAAVVTLLVSACGGGGNDAAPTPPPQAGNAAPVAAAGADQSVHPGDTVTLDGSGSHDSDGTVRVYAWTQISGPTVTLSNANAARTTFAAPATTSAIVLAFRLTVTDNRDATGTDDVQVAVMPVGTPGNATPVAHDDTAQTSEDTAVTVDVLANDTDADGAADIDRSSIAVSNAQHGTAVVSADQVTFTPATNFNGTASFQYAVNDVHGAQSNLATVTIEVSAVNDAPLANASSATGAEDTTITGQLSAADPDGDTLSYAVAQQPANGTVTISASGTFSYVPKADFNGSDQFTFTVSDGTATSAPAAVSLTITAVNDAPTANGSSAPGAEDTAITGQLTGSDAEGDALTFALASAPANGAVTIAKDGSYTYAPNANFNGADSFTFTVNDGSLDSAPATVSLTIAPVNDKPVAANGSANGDEDTVIAGQLSATDIDSTTLSYRAATQPAHGTVTVNADGSFSYTPAKDYYGSDTFTFVANDRELDSDAASVTLTIAAVNDKPVANSRDNVHGDEDTVIADHVTGSDVEGSALSFSAKTQPANGSVTMNRDGSFQYTPKANFHGSDSFTFVANDGELDSDPATVSITVADQPEATLSLSGGGRVAEDAGTVSFHIALSRKPDAAVTIHYTTADGTARAGQDYAATSGTVVFTPDAEPAQDVTVAIVNDTAEENDETFSFNTEVTAGADSVQGATTQAAAVTIAADDNDKKDLLRVGAGKHSIQPTKEEIDGIAEGRLGSSVAGKGPGTSHVQYFNLGGFGINPLSNIPDDPQTPLAGPCVNFIDMLPEQARQAAVICGDYVQQANETLTAHASRNVFHSSVKDVDENEMARAFVIEQKDGTRVAFVMFDAIGAGNVIEKNMTAAIVAGTQTCGASGHDPCFTGGPDSNVIIGMTHSHTASDLQGLWGGVPQQWIEHELYDGAVAAVRDALANLQAAHLRVSVGINNDFNSYRRPKIDPNADADGHMTLLVATADDGTPIGSILQYAAHPTDIGAGNKPRTPHPDFILGAADWLESKLGGGTALYYNGPIADASGSGERPGCWPQAYGADGSFGYSRCRGEGIADAALGFFNAHSRELAPTLAAQHVEVTLPVTNPGFLAFGATGSFNRYYDFAELPTENIPGIGPEKENLPQLTPTAKTEVSRVTIGGADSGLEIVTIPGEGTNTFGEYIRGLAKTDTMLLGLTHNSFGYILPEDEFSYVDQEGDDGLVAPWTGYEENVSMGPLTAPILRSQGYNKLFGVGAEATANCLANSQSPECFSGLEKEIPPTIGDCLTNPQSSACVARMLQNRVAHLIDQLSICYSQGIAADGCPLRTTVGEFDPVFDPLWSGISSAGATLNSGAHSLAQACHDNAGPLEPGCSVFDQLASAADTLAPVVAELPPVPNPEHTGVPGTFALLAQNCRDAGGPEQGCSTFDQLGSALGSVPVTGNDTILAPEIAKTVAMGCDFLDPSECLFPFPNDFFTTTATDGTPQAKSAGGTGLRVNFNPLGMPHNSSGKPVDPTEWNRNDGFSPGQMIVTYAPRLAYRADGTIPGAAPITDVAQSKNDDAPIFVIDYDTGERWPIWSEVDLNANLFEHGKVAESDKVTGAANDGGKAFNEKSPTCGDDGSGCVPEAPDGVDVGDHDRPLKDGRAALIIRPAKNFKEGHHYIVALRNLKDRFGKPLVPSLGFQACRGDVPSLLRQQSPMKERCDHIVDLIGTLAHHENNFHANDLYLTWDFTVASAKNDVGRLAHMRDVAFNSLARVPGTDCTQLTAQNFIDCAPPTFTVDKVTDKPQDGIARRVEGTITVPSFVTPVEPTPGDNQLTRAAVQAFCNGVPQSDFNSGCNDVNDIAGGATLPPNRLFYNPTDATPTTDASQAPYGDGLPDMTGSMQAPFICQIPEKAFSEPARASIYGHGLLDSRMAVTYEGSPQMEAEHNFMYCAVDLFGFATGDTGNVASTLVDLSNFPVVPDGSQQGLLNYMFLARAMRHPAGFAANNAFQNGGRPLFDTREIFYNGNSQGGIVGGAVLAISKDVNRGVLGSLGMNYSTLLQRSKDFDPYSVPLYTAYTDPLDRVFLFSMMQMLWDRSENNGYAEHLTQKSDAEGGPVDHVLLNSMYGDQQVTMWSAEVMARTMGIKADYGMVPLAGKHHPDLDPSYPDGAPAYYNEDGAQFSDESSALFNYAAVETDDHTPIGNLPHRAGPDPHDNSHRRQEGRCQISHWLQRDGGRLLNLNTDRFTPWTGDHAVDCPAIHPNGGAPGAEVGLFRSVIDPIVEAINNVLIAVGQPLADAISNGATQLGQAVGIYESAPNPVDANAAMPDPLRAGAAKGLIRVPVGTPLGGYLRPPVGGEYVGEDPQGELTDNINDGCDPGNPASCMPNAPLPDELRKVTSPYATFSPPSRGYYDSLTAKAVALYDGHDYVVLVKTDFIGMLDEVVQDVKKQVKTDTQIDLGSGLIMSATHTHDGPGALANNSTRYFWLAMDVYQHDVYLRVVGDLAKVVEDALANMKLAKIGHATGLDQLGMNHYRRGRFAYYKDDDAAGCNWTEAQADCNARDGDDVNGVPTDANELRRRIGVLEVQDASTSKPLALVVNFQAHGIAFDIENQYFSGDVLASLEREVEQGYTEPGCTDDKGCGPVTMFVQGTNGDVTPSADYSIRGIEQWGKKIAPEIRAIADRVNNFDAQPKLRTVSQRIVLNRHTLGYKDGEHPEYPYPYGAAQCGNDPAVPFADLATGAISDATGTPEVPTNGNDVPGYVGAGGPQREPYCIPATAPDAPDLADNGVAENGAFVPGDTILYAVKIGGVTLIANPGEPLTEYGVRMLEMAEGEGYNPHDTFIWGYTGDHVGYILPPVEDDWKTFGGAESTTTFWGWKQGERFIEVQKTLLDALRDGKAAPADEFQFDYSKYRQIYDAKPHVAPTPSSPLAGNAVAQPTNINRFEKTTFVFEGGDPVVDFPLVTMQKKDDVSGQFVDVKRANGEVMKTLFEMHLKYRFTTGRHLWTVEFEAPRDWTTGVYRFVVTGTYNLGVNTDYNLTSNTFTVSEATNLQLKHVQCGDGYCVANFFYTAAPTNYRIVDYRVSAKDAAPVRGGTVKFRTETGTLTATTDDNGFVRVNAGGTVYVNGVDTYGNTAGEVLAGPLDDDEDGVPNSDDYCPTEKGQPSTDPTKNGCKAQPSGLPLCAPAPYDDNCISDLDQFGFPGSTIQGVVDQIYNTANPGGGTPAGAHASCATHTHLQDRGNYQMTLMSKSGKRISFQVFEPNSVDCNEKHPLILQGHGFGGSRITDRNNGEIRDFLAHYAVISIDQRGFGDSAGTVRVMDPDYEGQDLVDILNWAETNLDYLVRRDDGHLRVGSIGGSYGGGYQFLLQNVDPDKRLVAMAPNITWHDLRYSLNPGDTLKSTFGLLLVAGGEKGSYQPGVQNDHDAPTDRGIDPYIMEVLARAVATGEFPREALTWFNYHSPSYWCGQDGEPQMPYDAHANTPVDPNQMVQGQLPGGEPQFRTHDASRPVDVLLSQGFRDNLFNFNDAWWNYQCSRVRGGDVRLITHQNGHIVDPRGLVSSSIPKGTPLDVQAPAGTNNCGVLNRGNAQLDWFDEKLRGKAPSRSQLALTDEHALCLSLSDNDAVFVPEEDVLAPRAQKFSAALAHAPTVNYYTVNEAALPGIKHGAAAQAEYAAQDPRQDLTTAPAGQNSINEIPNVAKLLTVNDGHELIVAGIAQAQIKLSAPTSAGCDNGLDVPTARTNCDATVFVGLGVKRAADGSNATWTLIDDQVTPVRGIGTHANVSFAGVAERLNTGDQLALLVYGYHRQYVGSYSRDATLPTVDVDAANIQLPLYAVQASGAPDFTTSADGSVTPAGNGGGTPPVSNGGVIGLLSDFTSHLNDAITAVLGGDAGGTQTAVAAAVAGAASDASHLGDDPSPRGVLGLDTDAQTFVERAAGAARDAEPVVITGSQIPDPNWSAPAARGVPNPYPSGAAISGQLFDQDPSRTMPGQVRDAHNGKMIYPDPATGKRVKEGPPIDQIAAYAFKNGAWVEIPVQVDERMPYFLANANSSFSTYSGTDQELTYVWDTESWGMTAGTCNKAYDPDPAGNSDRNRGVSQATPDPVPGLDDDDEIAFMASDAGDMTSGAPDGVRTDVAGVQVAMADPLDPSKQRYVYLFLKNGGSAFAHQAHYVKYQRDANADQWIDRDFFTDADPEKLGQSNTGYGPNLSGTVCPDGTPASARHSDDRFPRDGVTVTTDAYQWHASGRWMVREMHVAKPKQPGVYGPDLVDRWKGRAFQQNPDSYINLIGGFEDEQVNWEANSSLIGERAGPVRAIREVWGADSGTNVTKTETFYRDAVAYRYHVRVHPIPTDGLYTSWDYNRGAMIPTAAEAQAGVQGGRYFTTLRPQGVPIDGKNDDLGNLDGVAPLPNGKCVNFGDLGVDQQHPENGVEGIEDPVNGRCPYYFDVADPSFNLLLSFNNWEQVSGKGNLGSLVYTFENKGTTSYGNPLVVPYYRDDECFDDGTGDDPVQRPFPKTASYDPKVQGAYKDLDGNGKVDCYEKQGAYASHGVHYFFTGDTDNAFSPVTTTEIDGQQWQFAVPTETPTNVAEPYANNVRVPLQTVVTPLAPSTGGGGSGSAPSERGLVQVVTDFIGSIGDTIAGLMAQSVQQTLAGVNNFIAGIVDLLIDNPHASVVAVATDVVDSPADADKDVTDGASNLLSGFLGSDKSTVMAGVGVVDMTPDVGYCAGQYCEYSEAFYRNPENLPDDMTEMFDRGATAFGDSVDDGSPDAFAAFVQGEAENETNRVINYYPDWLQHGEKDPYVTAKSKHLSYGVQSRLTARAIVVQGSNGKRIALLKTDNYLAQDNLLRRVGQLLDADGTSGISYDQILYGVTHDHSATYNSTLAAGPMLFEDVYDARSFENQARKMARAIEIAAADPTNMPVLSPGERGSGLKAARMGATVAHHTIYKGNVVRHRDAWDGTPAGYPLEYNDHQLTVMRFDAADGSGPIATWINWGQHGEGNDGYDLHSADFVAALERFVERDTGAPMVYSQGDVGSSENTGNASEMRGDDGAVCGHWFPGAPAPADNRCPTGQGVLRDYDHKAYAANERNVRFLADTIGEAWMKIGTADTSVIVPMSADFPVDFVNNWVPGPVSHPYPSVSNCRTEATARGDTGLPVLGLPDCNYVGPADDPVTSAVYDAAKGAAVPVPDHYDAGGFEGVEENHRIHLQAFRLGEVLLASCACEAQNDVILNLKSRTDAVPDNIYDGFDWACLMPGYQDDAGPNGEWAAACERQRGYFDPATPLTSREGYPASVPGRGFTRGNAADDALIRHMRAEVHNDARGWDLPENAIAANSEPADTAVIWGNFTKQEIQSFGVSGFKLPVGVGHAGDYNGYTESYREYMDNGDGYREALTSYGPHTADYMVTRLVRMAAQLQGGPHIQPEPLDTFAQADEVRQQAVAIAHGAATAKAYEAFYAGLPADAGPAQKLAEPADIGYFNAATFTWQGGATAVDNPLARVERCVGGSDRACTGGSWQAFADGSGEVQTRTYWPHTPAELADVYTGQFVWKWTANFEAYDSFPSRLGATPEGFYRFVVDGCINDGGLATALGNIASRIGGFIAGAASNAECKAGSSYTLVSNAFQVTALADVVSHVTHDATSVSFDVSPTSVPRTYESAFPFVADADSDGQPNKVRICDHCSFRPWKQGTAAIDQVTISVNGGAPVAQTAVSGTHYSVTGLPSGAHVVINVSYADTSTGRPYALTLESAATAPAADVPAAITSALDAITGTAGSSNPQDYANAVVNGGAGIASAADAQSPSQPNLAPLGATRMASNCSNQSWIGGTTEICDGVLTYRDYVYDDHGADTQAIYNTGSSGTSTSSGGGPLSPFSGDATYPSAQLNTADLVKLTLARNGGVIDVVAELNTLYANSTTNVMLAVDTDNSAATGTQTLDGLTVAGADEVHTFDTRDAAANTITGSFPLPAGAHWKVWAVVTQGDANNTVMNVAFRGTNEEAKGLTGAGPLSGTWWEDKQARALAAKDITQFGRVVATADLVAGKNVYDSIGPGLHERIYTSAYTLAPGEGISAGGIPGRGGKNNYPCEQLFNFLGKYQPYGLYIPSAYSPADRESGLQLALHGCSANHASLINAPGMQQRFGEELNRVLVVPLGRGPQGFNSDIAERDVLDVLDDVQANYAIDPDQVYSGGYSMGGYGALRFAALYPDRFAGAVNWVGFTGDVMNAPVAGHPFSGVSDSGGFSNTSIGAEGNVIDFIGNLRHVPMANLYSGEDELVTVHTGLAMMEAFRNAVNVPYRFFFHPAAEHLTYALLDDWRKEASYLKGRKRVSQPAQVTFRTDESLDYPAYNIKHDSAYWISGIKRRGTSGYSDIDLVTRGCGASVPTYTTTADLEYPAAGTDPVPWIAEYRKESGVTSLGSGDTLMGTLHNVKELTIDAEGACLGATPTICIDTDGPVTVKFTDGRPAQTIASCAQPASGGLPVSPPGGVPPGGVPPGGTPGSGPIGIPGVIEIDPDKQCGTLFGSFTGCMSDLPL